MFDDQPLFDWSGAEPDDLPREERRPSSTAQIDADRVAEVAPPAPAPPPPPAPPVAQAAIVPPPPPAPRPLDVDEHGSVLDALVDQVAQLRAELHEHQAMLTDARKVLRKAQVERAEIRAELTALRSSVEHLRRTATHRDDTDALAHRSRSIDERLSRIEMLRDKYLHHVDEPDPETNGTDEALPEASVLQD